MKIMGETNIGIVRSDNQDCFTIKQVAAELSYAIVCDGMGGANGGQVASTTAMNIIDRQLQREVKEGMRPASIAPILRAAIAGANSVVYDMAAGDESLSGMGTTVDVAIVCDNTLHIGHVGDSRVYSFLPSENTVTQLTTDHTVVQVLLERGEITPQEALTHPQRNYITRAVGVAAQADNDYLEHPLLEEESILICSDGLYNYIPLEELPVLLTRCLREDSVEPLIARANAGGGGDNITAVLISRLKKGAQANG